MKLSTYLKETGTTQLEFAAKLGVDRVTLYRYLSGQRHLSMPVKLAIEYLTEEAVTVKDWKKQTKKENL